MEIFLEFLRNLCEQRDGVLQPAYRINGDRTRRSASSRTSPVQRRRPVRIGNQAFEHVQNDVYGGDGARGKPPLPRALRRQRAGSTAVEMIQGLVDQMDARLDEPDAGLWEFRGKTRLHTFSVLMHWAAGARPRSATRSVLELAARARSVEERARELLESRCTMRSARTQVAGEPQLDASLLLAVHLGFFDPDDPSRHVDAIRTSLSVDGGLLRRYTVQDDFGHMEAAFTVCTFWLVEALALIGRTDEARDSSTSAEPRQRPRPVLGGHPPGHARAERQLSADVRPRRAHQRGVRLAPLGLTQRVSSSRATGMARTTVPTPAHEALEVFVGRWRAPTARRTVTGRRPTIPASGVPWTSDESCARWRPLPRAPGRAGR